MLWLVMNAVKVCIEYESPILYTGDWLTCGNVNEKIRSGKLVLEKRATAV